MAESLPQLTLDVLLSALHQYRAFLPGETPVALGLDANGDAGTPLVLATLGYMTAVDPAAPLGLQCLDRIGDLQPDDARLALVLRGLDRVSRSVADEIAGAEAAAGELTTAWPDALEEVQP